MKLDAGQQHSNPMGTLHGGVIGDLADAAMGMAYYSTLEPGESFATLELKVNFLRPFWTGTLLARGVGRSPRPDGRDDRVRRRGRARPADREGHGDVHDAPGRRGRGALRCRGMVETLDAVLRDRLRSVLDGRPATEAELRKLIEEGAACALLVRGQLDRSEERLVRALGRPGDVALRARVGPARDAGAAAAARRARLDPRCPAGPGARGPALLGQLRVVAQDVVDQRGVGGVVLGAPAGR